MKKLWMYMKLFIVTALLYLMIPSSVMAANPQKVSLNPNKVYSKYDITGDGKADKIKFSFSGKSREYKTDVGYTIRYYNIINIYVNGKKAYSCNVAKEVGDFYTMVKGGKVTGPEVVLYTLGNGKPFLYVACCADGENYSPNALLQYKSGKLKEVAEFSFVCGVGYGSHAYCDKITVKGNDLYAKIQLCSHTVGAAELTVKYTYKSGTLKRAGNTFDLKYWTNKNWKRSTDRTLYSKQKIQVYTKVKGTKSFVIPANAKVVATKYWCDGKTSWVQIKYKNKTGWIKGCHLTKSSYGGYSISYLFSNLYVYG